MFDFPVVYVDVETSGGSPASSSIIEIGALRVEAGTVTDTYRSLVNPGKPVPYWITNITGITDADLVQAPYFSDIANQLHRLFEGALCIAHNVRFDYSFIRQQMEAAGYAFTPRLLCTVRLSRALYPKAIGHSLEKILVRHNLMVAARHRAFEDAQAIKEFAELAYDECGQAAFRRAVHLQLKNQIVR